MRERAESIPSLPQEKPAIKEKFAKLLIAALLFIACPGDDIVVITTAASSLTGQTQVDVKPILELFWINNNCDRMGIKKPEIPPVENCNDYNEEYLPN